MKKVRLTDGKVIKVYADFHSHTIYSGHAMSSSSEMAAKAASIGLEYLAITDHIYEYTAKTDIENQNFRARLTDTYLSDKPLRPTTCRSIKVLGGGEFNLFTNNPAWKYQGLRLFGYHSWFGPESPTIDEVLSEYERYCHLDRKPHIFVHPERIAPIFNDENDGRYFIKNLVNLAESYGIFVEINTSSFVYLKNAEEIQEMNMYFEYLLDLLNRSKCLITLGSDSHAAVDICINFKNYLSVLNRRGMLSKVINLDKDMCELLYTRSREN